MLKRTAAMFAAAAVTLTAALTLTAGTATATTAANVARARAATADPAGAAAPAPHPAVRVTLASTIALDDCSASLVRYPSSQNSDHALMLTAGHCFEGGMPSAGQVLQNVPSSRSGSLLDASGNELGTVRADKLLYATMTDTDISVYELTSTFATLASQYGVTPLTLSTSHPVSGDTIAIPSGYWDRTWSCTLNGFAATVEEDQWTWHDSLRYGRTGCSVIGGSSGSPVVDTSTGQVVGVNNTINENGQKCTLDNPCEVSSSGTVTYRRGQGYGQETYWVTTCLTSANAIDLSKAGCLLPKP